MYNMQLSSRAADYRSIAMKGELSHAFLINSDSTDTERTKGS